ncbi:MAG: hypothetical protein QXP51_04525, partial [Candidatus Hadarchaeales archaeon]
AARDGPASITKERKKRTVVKKAIFLNSFLPSELWVGYFLILFVELQLARFSQDSFILSQG